MKKLYLSVLLFTGLSVLAQTTTTRTAPAATPTTTQRGVIVRPTPGVSATPNPNNPNQRTFFANAFTNGFLSNRFNFSNQFAFAFTNGFNTNFSIGGFQGLLGNLQTEIEQALPVLSTLTSSLNNNGVGTAAITGTSTTGVIVPPTALPQAIIPPVQIPSVGTIGANNMAIAGESATKPGPPAPFLPMTGATNQRILAANAFQGTSASGSLPAILGALGTNTVAMNPETFQLVTGLQNSLQQTLALLQALNVLQTSGTAGGSALGFTNRFSVVTNSLNNAVLLPTGR